MNKTKNTHYLPKALISCSLMLCVFSQNVSSNDLSSQRIHDAHGHSHSVELDKKPIGKPSASISLDYELPENIIAGEEISLRVMIGSMFKTPGSLFVQYKADDGLNIVSPNSRSLDFTGEFSTSDILFIAENNGLYYLNLGVMQLDGNEKHVQARSFVIPINVGTSDYDGKMTSLQSKATRPVSNSESSSGNRSKIIEMIAN